MAEWSVLTEEKMFYGREISLHSADSDVTGDIRHGSGYGHDSKYHGYAAQDAFESLHVISLLTAA
jgi:hypothetical protein